MDQAKFRQIIMTLQYQIENKPTNHQSYPVSAEDLKCDELMLISQPLYNTLNTLIQNHFGDYHDDYAYLNDVNVKKYEIYEYNPLDAEDSVRYSLIVINNQVTFILKNSGEYFGNKELIVVSQNTKQICDQLNLEIVENLKKKLIKEKAPKLNSEYESSIKEMFDVFSKVKSEKDQDPESHCWLHSDLPELRESLKY